MPPPALPQADTFSLDVKTAGDLGAIFGMLNLFTRALGGVMSDVVAKYYGMRGRWVLGCCVARAAAAC